MWKLWLIVAILFFVLEMMGPGFLLFWVGIGAIITMIVSFFVDSVAVQIVIFILSSTVLLFCTRPFAKKFASTDTTITNANSILGKTALVTKEINILKGTGQIKVNGEVWSAKNTESGVIEEGSKVKVLSINGVKAVVEKI